MGGELWFPLPAMPRPVHPPSSRPPAPSLLQALQAAGLEKGANAEGHAALDKTRVGVLVGSGMGGLSGALRWLLIVYKALACSCTA